MCVLSWCEHHHLKREPTTGARCCVLLLCVESRKAQQVSIIFVCAPLTLQAPQLMFTSDVTGSVTCPAHSDAPVPTNRATTTRHSMAVSHTTRLHASLEYSKRGKNRVFGEVFLWCSPLDSCCRHTFKCSLARISRKR